MRTGLAVVLLLTWCMRQHLWELAPALAQARVWNACGAATVLVLLGYIGVAEKSLTIWAVIEVWAYEENTVLVCSLWRLADDWVVGPGEGQCSAKLGFRVGVIGIVAAGIIAVCLLGDLRKARRARS